jgi:citrate lyase subunit beta/citryl-CoA lyase
MTAALHPDLVLHQDAALAESAALPCCEHYAGSSAKLRKSLALQQSLDGAFDVTADLEDGALSGDEARTARDLANVLREPRPAGHRVGMRVHPPLHPAFDTDLAEIFGGASLRLSYITIPKIDHPTQLDVAAHAVARHAMAAGEHAPGLQILIESPAAVRHVARIAAHPAVAMLSFGQMDFVSSHRGAIPAQAMASPGQFDHPLLRRAKVEISAACQAAGKSAVHNPTTDYASQSQAGDDARRARSEFGFTRMWSIHPGQVSQILRAFAPSETELEDATRILLAAQAAQWGPIADQGRLHDRASYRYYWDLLRRARVQGGVIPAAAVQAFF